MSTITIPNNTLLPLVVSYLEQEKQVKLLLKGYSMRPFLENERDYALLEAPHEPVLYEPVLALLPDNRWVLHRIVKIEGSEITLLGDGNLTPEHCQVSDIKASVVGFYRKGHSAPDLISGRKWCIYSFIWIHLLPLRRYLLAIYRRIT